jgi:predicted unusual protein kinase regulating ubiquinone biosynthesis (AarF/ABC1/UbiB family)
MSARATALKTTANVFARYGGVLGKIAQLLSLEKESSQVFDNLDPVSTEVTHEYVISEVSEWDIYDEIIKIDTEIYKAGSLGQIYKADMNGKTVILKVQILGLEDNIKQDLNIIDFIAKRVYALSHIENAILDAREHIYAELDYIKEAENQQLMYVLNHDGENVIIPKVYRELCTKETMVMEFMEDCESLTSFINTGTPEEKSRIGNILLKFIFENIYKNGIFYSDNHYGNFLVKDKKTLCVLDFGCISKFDEQHVENIKKLHLSMLDKDRELFIKTTEDMGIVTDEVSEEAREYFYNKLLTHYKPFTDENFEFEPLWVEQTSESDIPIIKQLSLPRNVIYLHRIPYGLYHLLCKLGTKFDAAGYINETYIRKMKV